MKYFVYILNSLEFDKTYVGISNEPNRRLKEHNSGKSIFTRKFMPWEIVYKEQFDSRKFAREREKYFKSAAGRRRIKLLLKDAHVAQLDRATVS
jgi:putative endonuclease